MGDKLVGIAVHIGARVAARAEPDTIGMKVVSAVSGRRVMRSWLERSLENLKHVAEREPATL